MRKKNRHSEKRRFIYSRISGLVSALFMTPLAGDRSFFIQIVTGDAKFMSGSLAPVSNLSRGLVVALPALSIGKLLMFQMGKIQKLVAHLQFDNRCAGIDSKRVNRKKHRKAQKTNYYSRHKHTFISNFITN